MVHGILILKCSDIIELFSFLMNNINVKFQGRIYINRSSRYPWVVIVLPR